jgi:hypothetical protein
MEELLIKTPVMNHHFNSFVKKAKEHKTLLEYFLLVKLEQ